MVSEPRHSVFLPLSLLHQIHPIKKQMSENISALLWNLPQSFTCLLADLNNRVFLACLSAIRLLVVRSLEV